MIMFLEHFAIFQRGSDMYHAPPENRFRSKSSRDFSFPRRNLRETKYMTGGGDSLPGSCSMFHSQFGSNIF